jgi:hypothetical protein
LWEQLPDGVKMILRETLKQTGLDVDKIIPDPNAKAILLDKIREMTQGESFERGTSDPVPLPPQSQPPNVNPQTMPLSLPGPA